MANTTHNLEIMTELADYWEDDYWKEVMKEAILEVKVSKAKDRVIVCAVRWYEYDTYEYDVSSYPGMVQARTALNDACRDLQALRVQG